MQQERVKTVLYVIKWGSEFYHKGKALDAQSWTFNFEEARIFPSKERAEKRLKKLESSMPKCKFDLVPLEAAETTDEALEEKRISEDRALQRSVLLARKRTAQDLVRDANLALAEVSRQLDEFDGIDLTKRDPFRIMDPHFWELRAKAGEQLKPAAEQPSYDSIDAVDGGHLDGHNA